MERRAGLLILCTAVLVAAGNPFESAERLTVEQAQEAVQGKGTLSFRKLPEVSLEVANVLGQYKGELRLNGLKRITPEVARALSTQPKGANLCLNGLTQITPEVAAALTVRNGGMLSLNALTEISPEVARELGKVRAKLTLNGLQSLPVEVAHELAKHPSKLTLFSVAELSDGAAEAIAEHQRTLLLHGLLHLSSPKLVAKMLRSNDGFVSFKNARSMTEEVAQVFAVYDGRKKMSLEGLQVLPETTTALLCGNEKLLLPAHLEKPGLVNSLGMRLAYVPAGKFGMGSPRDEPGRKDEERRHEVELTRAFYLGTHEVTVGQFRAFAEDAGYKTDSDKDGKGCWGINPKGGFERDAKYNWMNPGFEQADDHPVVDVSWNDAKAFCAWLSKKEGKNYRLPTEAEWEYACRAGTRTAFSFGDDPQDLAKAGNAADATARKQFSAWSLGIKGDDGHAYSAPVGQFEPNRYGLYDMHGNVWEWCEDWYAEDAYPKKKRIDPTGPETGTMRVHRGGGWSSAPDRCRSASRIRRHPSEYRGAYLGFRVLLEASSKIRVVQTRDPKLNQEFETLVYDLGAGVELKLVKVQAKGKRFTIGSSKEEQNAVAQKYFQGKRSARMDYEDEQVVTMTDDYYMGRCEVTRGQFRRFVEASGYITETEQSDGGYGWNEDLQKFEGRDHTYNWRNTGIPGQSDEHPVTNITRGDARAFCRWLSAMGEGTVRLPGEAEWEFACRAGSPGRFSCGDDEDGLVGIANLSDGSRREAFPEAKGLEGKDGHVFIAPVGQLKPNAFGLYDMHGNVWEWCEDFFGRYAALPKRGNALQTVNQGERRPVMRGGAWYVGPGDARCAKRYLVGIKGRYGGGGFRVVCVP